MQKLQDDPLQFHPKFEAVELLGAGSFGVVVKARYREPDEKGERKEVAIKLLRRGPNITRYVETEIIQQSKFWHPHVVALKDIFLLPRHLAIVLELVPGGDLFSYVRRKQGCSEKQARWIFQQLIMGIDYVHKMGVSQRDIKLENTLVVDSREQWPTVKITDFGYAKGADQSECKTLVGTSAYMAPEVLRGGFIYNGQQADMWSCGVMLYVLLYCCYPFAVPDKVASPAGRHALEIMLRAEYPIPEHVPVSDACLDLLQKLLTPSPSERINAAGVLRHPWFVQVFEQKDTEQLPKGPL